MLVAEDGGERMGIRIELESVTNLAFEKMSFNLVTLVRASVSRPRASTPNREIPVAIGHIIFWVFMKRMRGEAT